MKRPPGADGRPHLPLRVRLLRYRLTIMTVLVLLTPLAFAWAHNASASNACQERGGVLVRSSGWGTECVQAVPR